MFERTAAVVEVGASHVAFGRLQVASAGRLRLLECAVEQIGSDAIFEPAWLEKVSAALVVLRTRSGHSGEISLVLPPHLALAKFVTTPRAAAAHRERIIQFEAQQALPLSLSDLVWDSAAAGEHEAETMVMLSAIKRENIEALGAAVDAVDFVPRRIVPSLLPLLAGYRMASAPDAPPTLLCDIGARSVVLLLVEPRRFCGRCFALGGPAAIDQLTTELLALRLKQETTRSLVHFGQRFSMSKPSRVVLTGGGAGVAGLADLLAAKFQLPVSLLDIARAVDVPAGMEWPAQFPVQLAGAAAMELFAGQAVIDLRPESLRRREMKRRRQPWLVAAGAVAALAVVPPMLYYRDLAAAMVRRTVAIEQELAPLRARAAIIESNRRKIESAKRQLAGWRQINEGRSSWIRFLADLQGRLLEVEDVWIEQMRVQPAAGSAPGPAMRLALSGRMLDRANPLSKVSDETRRRVRQLLAAVAASPLVASVEAERFDSGRPGLLRFDFVVVMKAGAGLPSL